MTCPSLSSRRLGAAVGIPARRVFRAALATVCAMGLLVACSDSSDTPHAAGTPEAGGELVMGLRSDVISLDPLTSRSDGITDGSRMTALYDALLWTDATTKTVHPHMAESMTGDATGTNWTLRLRPGIAFSDGTVLDAAAVQFNWDRQRASSPDAEGSGAAAARQISAMTVASGDPLTLHVKLVGPNSNFDRSVSRNLNFIASPTAIRAAGPDGLRTKPVGAGPFVMDSHTPGQALVLKRNPRYWQADKGLPHLDKITFVPQTDVQQIISGMKDGDVDLTVTRYAPDKAVAEESGLGVVELPLDGGAMLQFNTRVAPFDNPDARLAVTYALSAAEINDQIYAGQGKPARGVFSSLSPLANPQLSAPDNDPRKAAELFDKLTANGTRKFEFTYSVPASPLSEKMAGILQAKLGSYRGVTMNIRVMPILEFVKQVAPGLTTWQSSVGQSVLDDPEPLLYNLLHSESPSNLTGIDSPAIDEALTAARTTTSPAARRLAYTRLQVALSREMPFWTYQEAFTAAIFRPEITGVQPFNDGLILWDRIGIAA